MRKATRSRTSLRSRGSRTRSARKTRRPRWAPRDFSTPINRSPRRAAPKDWPRLSRMRCRHPGSPRPRRADCAGITGSMRPARISGISTRPWTWTMRSGGSRRWQPSTSRSAGWSGLRAPPPMPGGPSSTIGSQRRRRRKSGPPPVERQLLRQDVGESAEIERPSGLAVHAVADYVPTVAVAVEVPVLEFDACAVRRLGDESHIDLAGLLDVRLDLPLRADVPADHDSIRRLVREHPGPATLAAVDTPVVDMAALTRLEDRLRDIHAKDVVLGRLEAPEAGCEDRERALDRRLDDDLVADGRCCWRGHVFSSSGCSTADLYAVMALVQNRSCSARSSLGRCIPTARMRL